MKTSKFPLLTGPLFALVLGLSVSMCGDDDNGMGDDDDDDDDAGWMCDPVGAYPEMGTLLNAPLDPSVEVIVKTPQHPGNPGPLNLP